MYIVNKNGSLRTSFTWGYGQQTTGVDFLRLVRSYADAKQDKDKEKAKQDEDKEKAKQDAEKAPIQAAQTYDAEAVAGYYQMSESKGHWNDFEIILVLRLDGSCTFQESSSADRGNFTMNNQKKSTQN